MTPVLMDANEHKRSTRIAGYLPIGGKRLLDIGCARGYLLQFARNRGYDILGVEPCNDFTFDDIPHVHSIDEVQGQFDVITCIHTLEHTPDFVYIAERVKELLEPGGMLIIEVPSRSSGGAFSEVHINFFTPSVLMKLFHPLKQILLKHTPNTFMTFSKEG